MGTYKTKDLKLSRRLNAMNEKFSGDDIVVTKLIGREDFIAQWHAICDYSDPTIHSLPRVMTQHKCLTPIFTPENFTVRNAM